MRVPRRTLVTLPRLHSIATWGSRWFFLPAKAILICYTIAAFSKDDTPAVISQETAYVAKEQTASILVPDAPVPGFADAVWEQTNGPEGGRIAAIHSFRGLLFVGTECGGVYCSADTGMSWVLAADGLGSWCIYDFAVFCGQFFAGTEDGVYRFDFDGRAWAKTCGIPKGTRVNTFASDELTLYAGTSTGMYISADTGRTWGARNKSVFPSYGVNAIAVSGNYVLAEKKNNGLLRSKDKGITWLAIPDMSSNVAVYSLFSTEGLVLAGTSSGLLYSTDHGGTWHSAELGLSSGQRVYALSEAGSHLYVATGTGMYTTRRRALQWSKIGLDKSRTEYIISLYVYAGRLFAGTNTGVLEVGLADHSLNQRNKGIYATSVNTTAKSDSRLYAGAQAIYVYVDRSGEWEQFGDDQVTSARITSLAATNHYLYAGTFGQGLYRKKYGESAWKSCNTGFPYPPEVRSIARTEAGIFVATNAGIYQYSNYHGAWTSINSNFHDLGQDPAAFVIAWFGQKLIVAGDNIYTSPDTGRSWAVHKGSQTLCVNGHVTSMVTYQSRLYLGTFCGVYRTKKKEIAFSPIRSGLAGDTLVCALTSNGKHLFAGTAKGTVYHFDSTKEMWNTVGSGLKITKINSLTLLDGYLYAGVDNAGVWRFPIRLPGQNSDN